MFKYEQNNSKAGKAFIAGKRVICVTPNRGALPVDDTWNIVEFSVNSGNQFYVWVD